jgi:hypothetical protein
MTYSLFSRKKNPLFTACHAGERVRVAAIKLSPSSFAQRGMTEVQNPSLNGSEITFFLRLTDMG